MGDLLDLLRLDVASEPATFIQWPESGTLGDTLPATAAGSVSRQPKRFTAERLAQRAARLAATQRVSPLHTRRARGHPLWEGLGRCERVIEAVLRGLADATRASQAISLSGQWLVDNAYVVRREIGDVRRNFSRHFYDVLPVLAGEPYAGEPRIYELARELVSHAEAQVHAPEVLEFLRAFESQQPLTMGELWAMPLTLRLALIEQLAHLAAETQQRQREHDRADFWANRLLSAARLDPDRLLTFVAELAREYPHPRGSFVDRLVRQLQGESLALEPLRGWLERKLGATIAEVGQREQRDQTTDQVMIANAITSLRRLEQLDWRQVFEQVSSVEDVLRRDPAGVYPAMDFGTRDQYRHVVEEIARRARRPEVAIAEAALQASESARAAPGHAEGGAEELAGHVGYHLIGAGRRQFEVQNGCQVPLPERFRRWMMAHPAPVYLGGVALGTAAGLAALLSLAASSASARPQPLAALAALLLALLAALPVSEVAVQLVNYAVTRVLPARVLPKLWFDDGIPDEWRTLVVVPMLLSAEDVQHELERLEVRFLGNKDPNLHFALLTDFRDAPQQVLASDTALLDAAVAGIQRLNRRYDTTQFSLFHRQRLWSETEQVWMGWERKRGKLEELNRYLIGEREGTLQHVGDAEQLQGVRFVITLDSDSQLPHGAARRMVETLAHPLNRPRLAPDGQTVAGGYAIVQPRVTTSLPSATATRFSRVFTDPVGTDPYTQAVSDVYQDLAGEGSYHGKGIYDLRAFHAVLDDHFPEVLLLSHDLLEGAHVRVGLATDIELFDLFPGTYLAYANRAHRWIRGDWQIAEWCTPWVPDGSGGRARNPLSALNRWKIFDNLRRSLVPPAAILLLAGGWLLWPGVAWLCTALVAATLLLPPAIGLLSWLLAQPGAALTPWRGAQGWAQQGAGWVRAAFVAALLPYQALVSIDAIWRVFHRRTISRRYLLQWQTSRAASASGHAGERTLAWQVGTIAGLAAALGGALVASGSGALPAALPFLVLWILSPAAAAWLGGRWLSRRWLRPTERPLPSADRALLRRLARQTWRYFDDLVTEGTHWLPPDNSQTALRVEVAERTSPTNVGLYLLALLAAHDFGYLTLDQLIERSGATLDTLHRLQRFDGHLFNWYHTGTLEPLPPRYISTVDSGNLLASLTTFVQGVSQKLSEPVLGPAALRGVADTLAALDDEWAADLPGRTPAARLKTPIATLRRLVDSSTHDARQIGQRLQQAAEPVCELLDLAGDGHAGYWARQVERQVAAHQELADRYLAWASPTGASLSLRALAAGPAGEPAAGPAARAQWLAGEVLARAERVIAQARQLAGEMNMRFLYDPEQKLFTIGYNADERRADLSHYDLLASESRLGSLVAIARGDVPVEHWLALGRTFGRANGHPVLLSWAGTMFEYLMPLLLTKTYEHSLLDEACRAAVEAQIAYGARQAVPWGISEAAFSAVDARQIYQYQAFGVPALGLKRGLENDLVVAPYATALALIVEPRRAVANLRVLEREGGRGDYGLYESIDYTPLRRGPGERSVIVHTFMAHHQGMTLLALDNVLHDNPMPARLHADPHIRAVESLLFERIPADRPAAASSPRDAAPAQGAPAVTPEPGSRFTGPDSPAPRAQLLGNQSYSVMVTSAGGGYSRWQGLDVSRWAADTTRDCWGSFIYLRDLDDGLVWSAAHHPVGRRAGRYTALLAPGRVEFERRDGGIGTRTEITVSSEDDAEVRRVTLANLSGHARRVEVTSYVELALAAHAADRAHPAFSKLFVQTEALVDGQTLLAWRKPRSQNDPSVWAAHLLALPPEAEFERVQHETNRGRFIGRGRSAQNPQAMEGDLSDEAGYVLDPIFSLRARVSLAPGQRVQLAFITMAAPDRDAVMALVRKYQDLRTADRALELAWSHAQLVPRQLRISAEDVQHFRRLAGHMLFPNKVLRASQQQLVQEGAGQARLWSLGISGDLPIMLLEAGAEADLALVREVLTAHTYWRLHGLQVDLVILNEESASYEQPVGEAVKRLVEVNASLTGVDRPGGVFVRAKAHVSDEDLAALRAVAHVVLVASRGPLAQQLTLTPEQPRPAPLSVDRHVPSEPSAPLPFMELPYFNGFGGFTPDGREYAIYLGADTHTPAPWINVLANPQFGALVSEAGHGSTWYGNSQSNRLLPWSNDQVTDPAGDAIYLRDEHSGYFWTPTPAPVRELDAYRARHGQGYTVFEHNSHAIEQELTVSVPVDERGGVPVRLQRLRLRNASSRRRRLSITSYAEWVLGSTHEETQLHVVSSWDAESGALMARNRYHPHYGSRVAFASASVPVSSFTADRTEFLGRNGSAIRPAAMVAQSLSGRSGAGIDPCAALQVVVELDPGEDTEVTFVHGQATDATEARQLVRRFGDPAQVNAALDATRAWWDRLLDTVQVDTPDLAINFLLNRWLPYQTLACRVWGRSAFYQSGGAYGFRDQLQDAMALVYADPTLVRALVLGAAAHQFREGDVQHWWHQESSAGVRTRISDDLLWLPYVVAHYVRITGDAAILAEQVPFLEGRVLAPDEHEALFVPSASGEAATLMEHCRRAIAKGLTAGQNGLPLMGTGDWNDGMNLVGAGGKGESVWLAWFSIAVLNGFAELVERQVCAGDAPAGSAEAAGVAREARGCRERARSLAEATEAAAWDGAWYRRATFDDGTPLGSQQSSEAQIDSLPQSWAVLSGAANHDRATQAMASADERLVRGQDGLVLLFAPPFHNPSHDPGYIQGYPPGVRENGGQYTHGAIWLAMAHARLGNGERAVQLLRMLNPVEHARTPEDVERYRVEPYAVAADVYALDGHVGQGGWTWYTGSSGWMYRAWLEEILGFKRRGDRLELNPTLPPEWDGFTLRYRHRGERHETLYVIAVENVDHVSHGVAWLELDGRRLAEPELLLQDDGATHQVTVRLGLPPL